MKGRHYSILKEISAAITQAIRRMNKDGVLDAIVKLSRRWDLVIEKYRNYIER